MRELKYKNIAIIKLSSLGDIIHSIPAFDLLRKEFFDSKISWIVEPTGAKLLSNFLGIDEIVVLNLKAKGFFRKIREIKRIIFKYRKKFDLIIDFQGLLKSAILAYLLRGYTIGFNNKNLKESFAKYFYKATADFYDEKNHVIFKNIHLLRSQFSKQDLKSVNYPLKKIVQTDRLKEFMTKNNLEIKNFLIINVGGGWESKLLDINQYLTIVNRIKDQHRIVLLWGNIREKKVAEYISRRTNTVMSILFNFSELILFIKFCKLIITADTLALHIADMVKTPSIGIFGPTSPYRNGSLLKESVSIYKKLTCSFCYKKKCDKIECIKRININQIIESVKVIDEK